MLKRFGLMILAAGVAAPATAQVHIMGRQDKTDIVYTVNQPDGLAKAKKRAEEKDGTWALLLEDSKCGYGAIWYAANGSDVKYFIVTGDSSARGASEKAAAQARAYAQGRDGWHAGIMRTFVNENRYSLRPSLAQELIERTVGMASCLEQRTPYDANGKRG